MTLNIVNSEAILKSLCPEVRKVCNPIFNYLSVSFFRYVRSYPNNEKFIIASDENWLEEYFKDKLYDVEYANFHKVPKLSSGISIHSKCSVDDPVCNFWNKMSDPTDYNLIMALYEKNETYLEFYNFGLTQDTHAANNIFLNNHSLFHHFIEFFRDQGQGIIQKAELAKFVCKAQEDYTEETRNNWMLGLDSSLVSMVVEQMPIEKFYLNGNLDKVFLTKQEAILVKCMLNGEPLANIAKKLSLADKDVQDIQKAIMTKLKANNEQEMKKILSANRIAKKLSYI